MFIPPKPYFHCNLLHYLHIKVRYYKVGNNFERDTKQHLGIAGNSRGLLEFWSDYKSKSNNFTWHLLLLNLDIPTISEKNMQFLASEERKPLL